MAWAPRLDLVVVDEALVGRVHTDDGRGDLLVDVLDRLEDALAAVALGIAVAEFERLVLTGGCTGRNGCGTYETRIQDNFCFNGRVASRIEDFPAGN